MKLIFDRLKTAGGRANGYTDPLRIFFGQIKLGVGDSQLRSGNGKLYESVCTFDSLVIHVLRWIEVIHFGCNFAGRSELLWYTLHQLDTGSTVYDAVPELLLPVPTAEMGPRPVTTTRSFVITLLYL